MRKKLGLGALLLCLVMTGAFALGACGPKTPDPVPSGPDPVKVSAITVSGTGVSGSGTAANPYTVTLEAGTERNLSYTVVPSGAANKEVELKYATVSGTTVTDAAASAQIGFESLTATGFKVKAVAAGTGWLSVKSKDGGATALLRVNVYEARALLVSAETTIFTPDDYYHHDESGDIGIGNDGSTVYQAVVKRDPYTGEPVVPAAWEQVRNIYKEYVNGFERIADADRADSTGEYFNADYRFVGIQGTTLNATFGELYGNKENHQNVSFLSSTNSFANLDQFDNVRYYKNMLFNTFTIDASVATKTLNVKYYSDGALETEIIAANSPVKFTIANGPSETQKKVSFDAQSAGSVWAKFYAGTNESADDATVVKVTILPTYGSGIQKSDFDAKSASTKLDWDFAGNEGTAAADMMKQWRVSFLNSANKLQVKAFYLGVNENAGAAGFDTAKGFSIANRFETFTNTGLPYYATLVQGDGQTPASDRWVLPFDYSKPANTLWNKITLPAEGVVAVTASISSTPLNVNLLDARVRLVDVSTGAEAVGTWVEDMAGETRNNVTLAIPAGMLGKTVAVVIEGRWKSPVYNADADMRVYAINIA